MNAPNRPLLSPIHALMDEVREQARLGDRRADLVLRVVREALVRGIVGPGDRLPTELELASALGISRAPVREAMRVLQAIGLVEIRPRSGAVVRDAVSGSMAQLMLFESRLHGASIEALTEVRRVFERACAELAAERATEDDLARMREAIERLDKLRRAGDATLDALVEADIAFHRAVYRATQNPLIESLASFTLTMVSPWMRDSLMRTGAAQSVELHRREFDLIAQRQGREIRGSAVSAEADRGIDHWLSSLK
jgi:DNA-binding FadR family transcriptional regulator